MTVPSRESVAMQTYTYVYPSSPEQTYEIGFKFLGLDENIGAFLRMADNSAFNLREGTHYSVATAEGNNNIWGTFQFEYSSDLPKYKDTVKYLCIYRKITNDQAKRFDSQTIFSSTTEYALDKLTMLIQDYMAESKYIRVPIDTNLTGVDLELELPPLNEWKDGSILGFKQEGNVYKLTVFSENALNMGIALRQSTGETEDPSFEIKLENRSGKILGFNEYGSVEWHDPSVLGAQSDWEQKDDTKADYIKNKPNLATVATSGNYNDLSNKPGLATVATSGNYNDLSNKLTAGTNIQISGNTISGDSASIMRMVYPIGSVMIRYDTINPNTLTGLTGTAWSQISSGSYVKTAITSIGSTGGNLFTGAGNTGSTSGSTEAANTGSTKITISQMPSHTHQAASYQREVGYSGNTNNQYFTNGTQKEGGGDWSGPVETGAKGEDGGHDHTIPPLTFSNHAHTIPALSINPTYIQLAFWRRTA